MNKQTIEIIALRIIEKRGIINITRSEICKRAKILERDFPVIMEMTFSAYVKYLELTAKKKGQANPILRKAHIMHHALHLAQEKYYYTCTRDEIAERAGVSSTLITYHFGTTEQFRWALMRAAITNKNLHVLADGIERGDPLALSAPKKLKQQAQLLTLRSSIRHGANG